MEEKNNRVEIEDEDPLSEHVQAMRDQTEAIDNLAGSIDELKELLEKALKKFGLASLLGGAFKKKAPG